MVIYARDLPVRLRGAELRYLWPPRAYVATIVAKGIPMGLQLVAASLSALAMLGLVNREGTQPFIASLTDPAQPVLSAGRMFLGSQSKPGGAVTAAFKVCRVYR